MFKWFSRKKKDPDEEYISKAKYKEDIVYAYRLGAEAEREGYEDEANYFTVEAMLDLNEHPSFTEDDVIERGKEFITRDLGKEVYKYAKHFLTEDNKYIVSVTLYVPNDEPSLAEEEFEAWFGNV